jgi:hypothetical protein
VVNPKVGSDLKYGREVEEEKTAEVVENHRGGTRMGIGVPISKAGSDKARPVALLKRRLLGVPDRHPPQGGLFDGDVKERSRKARLGREGSDSVSDAESRSDADTRSDAATRSGGRTQGEVRIRSDAATRSEEDGPSGGLTRSQARHGATRQRGAARDAG